MLHSESSLWVHYNQNEKWRGVTESLKFHFSLGLEHFKNKSLVSFIYLMLNKRSHSHKFKKNPYFQNFLYFSNNIRKKNLAIFSSPSSVELVGNLRELFREVMNRQIANRMQISINSLHLSDLQGTLF